MLAIGRVATETRIGPKPIAKRVTEGGGRILHGPFALPPHMEEVVIILVYRLHILWQRKTYVVLSCAC